MNKPAKSTNQLDALDLRSKLAAGEIAALQLVEACLARIAAREPTVQAWTSLDFEAVRAEAREKDRVRDEGKPLGPLHGLPVGLKDVIDTVDMPTENGCPLDAERKPDRDAVVVQRLKDAGAIVMGKTVTTELAFMYPGKTRNPHNPAHTPGGSSSGSAAAVADGMIPLAVGTQTGGSVIRPAAFCGVTGLKPSFGRIPRSGVLMQSHTLDTIGVFASTPRGAALLVDVLSGPDDGDPATQGEKPLRLLNAPMAKNDPPRFAFTKPPGWAKADAGMRTSLEGFCKSLGARVTAIDLPDLFEEAAAQRLVINLTEMAHHFDRYWTADKDKLGPQTRDAINQGQQILASAYLHALEWRKKLNASLTPVWAEYDAILCPAAPGPAPTGLHSTGSSLFNGLWTLCGTPAMTLPVMTAENGLPMGVQIVGAVGEDGALIQAAEWLWNWAGKPTLG